MSSPSGYADAVADVLREHFPALADPVTSGIVTKAITRQVSEQRPEFEVIIDDPISARWRLKACRSDRRRVRLACFGINLRESDAELEHIVNEALLTLEDR